MCYIFRIRTFCEWHYLKNYHNIKWSGFTWILLDIIIGNLNLWKIYVLGIKKDYKCYTVKFGKALCKPKIKINVEWNLQSREITLNYAVTLNIAEQRELMLRKQTTKPSSHFISTVSFRPSMLQHVTTVAWKLFRYCRILLSEAGNNNEKHNIIRQKSEKIPNS